MEAQKLILKYELKYHTILYLLVSVGVIGLGLFVFGTKNLDIKILNIVIERILPLMGIILISPLFQFEIEGDLLQVIDSKPIRPFRIYGTRLVVRTLIYIGLTVGYILLLKVGNNDVDIIKSFYHSVAIGLLLASIGVLIYSNTHHLISSFFLPLIIYLLNWGLKPEHLGVFHLFRWGYGLNSYDLFYIFISIILLICGLIINEKRLNN